MSSLRDSKQAPLATRPVVVVATYNERPNVERLLPELLALHDALRVVVVDDASPDGTAEAVEDVAKRHPDRVHLVRRAGKLGYGSAFVTGFARALELDPDAVVSMDADLSHDPQAVPALLAALRACDVAVGSRYLGGTRILNWSLRRLFLSRAANWYVRALLPGPVKDRTSGYRAYRSEVLRRIVPTSTRSEGYAFLVEILELVMAGGFRVGEVPIVFEDRQLGRSKLDRGVVLEAVWRPWLLLLRRIVRRVRS